VMRSIRGIMASMVPLLFQSAVRPLNRLAF
jgi:hypothetical protein